MHNYCYDICKFSEYILFVIDGEALFELSEEEIREMLPPIGLTKRIMYLIQSVSIFICAHYT